MKKCLNKNLTSRWSLKKPLYLKKTDKRYARHLKQLKTNGFSDAETWGLDSVIAEFILPRLIRFRELHIDFPGGWEDVTFEKWNSMLDEMIFAFEHMVSDDWQDEFRSGEHDINHVPCKWDEEGKPTLYTFEKGPKDTFKCDWDAIFAVEKRMDNGFRLFGTYYRNLWD